MVPFDVDDFVAEHAGQFICRLRSFDQTGEQVNRSAGDGKGV